METSPVLNSALSSHRVMLKLKSILALTLNLIPSRILGAFTKRIVIHIARIVKSLFHTDAKGGMIKAFCLLLDVAQIVEGI